MEYTVETEQGDIPNREGARVSSRPIFAYLQTLHLDNDASSKTVAFLSVLSIQHYWGFHERELVPWYK